MLRVPSAALGVVLSLAACSSAPEQRTPEQRTIGAVRWYTDYDAAALVGREVQKPLWVHFGEDPG